MVGHRHPILSCNILCDLLDFSAWTIYILIFPLGCWLPSYGTSSPSQRSFAGTSATASTNCALSVFPSTCSLPRSSSTPASAHMGIENGEEVMYSCSSPHVRWENDPLYWNMDTEAVEEHFNLKASKWLTTRNLQVILNSKCHRFLLAQDAEINRGTNMGSNYIDFINQKYVYFPWRHFYKITSPIAWNTRKWLSDYHSDSLLVTIRGRIYM